MRGAPLFSRQTSGRLGVVDAHRLAREQGHFLGAEQFGQKQPALAVEIVDLLLGQFHGFLLVLQPICRKFTATGPASRGPPL